MEGNLPLAYILKDSIFYWFLLPRNFLLFNKLVKLSGPLVCFKMRSYTGYDITLSGFWLKRNGEGLKPAGEAVLYAGRNA